MERPNWVTNEGYWIKTCERVVNLCTDYLEGRMGLIETSRELDRYSVALRMGWDNDFLTFRVIDSQSDHLPVGRFREGWANDALAKKDMEIKRVEDFYRAAAVKSAQNLINRYHFTPPDTEH